MSFYAEQRIAKLRPRTGQLFWPFVVLFLVSFALGFFGGRLAEQWQNILFWSVTGLIALIFWLLPVLRFASTFVELTTSRVILRSGLFGQNRNQVSIAQIRQVELTPRRSVTLYVEGQEALVIAGMPKHKLLAAEIERLTASI